MPAWRISSPVSFRTQLSSTSTLTPAYLGTIGALIISVGFTNASGITPLSASEQSALLGFVEAGGTALLFTDNGTFSGNASAINSSFPAPFGLSAAGTLNGLQSSTIVNAANPVVHGIDGTATSFDTNFPGWFSSLGSAEELATLSANGEPDLAFLAPGALGVGSGAVVFFSDGNNLAGEPAGGSGIGSQPDKRQHPDLEFVGAGNAGRTCHTGALRNDFVLVRGLCRFAKTSGTSPAILNSR
jgi:hypothetical protein